MTDLTFYEFFCGGGGARAGLGDGWQCLLANDNDPVKTRSYTDNWGGRDVAHGLRCRPPDPLDSAGRRSPRLGVFPLPGPLRGWRRGLGLGASAPMLSGRASIALPVCALQTACRP